MTAWKNAITFSLKVLAKEYDLSEQAMRSRLKNIGCFPDGKGSFFIVNDLINDIIFFKPFTSLTKLFEL